MGRRLLTVFVLALLAAVTFLCILWVRSYWIADKLQVSTPSWHEIATYRGRLFYAHGWSNYPYPFYTAEIIAGTPWAYDLPTHEWYVLRAQGEFSKGYFYVGMPLWIPIGVTTLLSALVWRGIRRKSTRSAFPIEAARPAGVQPGDPNRCVIPP